MKTTSYLLAVQDQAVARGFEEVLSRMAQEGRALTNMALFFAAPFIGLVYIIIFPFVGFAALAKTLFQKAAIGK